MAQLAQSARARKNGRGQIIDCKPTYIAEVKTQVWKERSYFMSSFNDLSSSVIASRAASNPPIILTNSRMRSCLFPAVDPICDFWSSLRGREPSDLWISSRMARSTCWRVPSQSLTTYNRNTRANGNRIRTFRARNCAGSIYDQTSNKR